MIVNVVYEVCVGSMPPVNEKYVLSFLRFVIVGDVSTVERDDVSALEFHFFDETTPSFSHHVALATAPIRVAEPSHLSGSVFKVQYRTGLIVL